MTSPYKELVDAYDRLQRKRREYPCGSTTVAPRPDKAPDAPVSLIFAPHPDDECVIGALALRLLRQTRTDVRVVAVTQGSNPDRQSARLAELKGACRYLGFGLIQTANHGLERVNPESRRTDPDAWKQKVTVIADILRRDRPRIIFFPHDQDWNSTHLGVHDLVIDALKSLRDFPPCFCVETEFWGQMNDPNLMVESATDEVVDLVTALSFHEGEVRRNPFHTLLPAWMQDNVRRGSELVGGQGKSAPDFIFATLYRLRLWKEGQWESVSNTAPYLASGEDPETLFVR